MFLIVCSERSLSTVAMGALGRSDCGAASWILSWISIGSTQETARL